VGTPFAGDDGNAVICESGLIDLFTYLQNTPNVGGTWYDPAGAIITMPTATVTGTYKYKVSNGACSDSADVVVTSESVIANFTYTPVGEPILVDETDVTFQQNSTNALYHEWFVGNVSEALGPLFVRNFPASNFYDICLVSFNDNCSDTICTPLYVEERLGVFVPNTFTPDADGKNELFSPVVSGEITSYEFRVFNRWGQVIFFGNDFDEQWDGKHKGVNCPEGVYVWKVDYKTESGAGKQEQVGHINLVR
jgi:gliding motility-associated-like protein